MSKSKGFLLLLLAFTILPLGSATACGQPGHDQGPTSSFNTYANDDWGCAISYPSDWEVQVVPADRTCLMSPPTAMGRGSLRLDVIEALSAEQAAERWIIALGTTWGSVTMLHCMKMEGLWDWYLSYDYDSGYGQFHGEAFFKEGPDYLYKIDTAGEKAKYDTYGFHEIVPTFELLAE